MIFHPEIVVSSEGAFIPLKYIESIRLAVEGEDLVIAVLNGDTYIDIRTLSGKEYRVYMHLLKELLSKLGYTFSNTATAEEFRNALIKKWIHQL